MAGSLTARGEARVDTPVGPIRVPFVLPGETVRVTRLHRSGGSWRGRADTVVTPSAERREPPCPLFAECGGCALMAMSIEAQKEHKRQRVARAVERVSTGSGAPVDVRLRSVPDAPHLAYRRRARMTYRRTARGVVLGYRAHRSHRIVDVDQCPVLVPPLTDALTALREALAPSLQGTGEVRLYLGAGGRAALSLQTDEPQPPAVYAAAEALTARGILAGVALWVAGATAAAQWGDPREHLTGWDGLPLVGPPAGFAQANDQVSRAVAGCVRELAEPEGARIVELYAGHGNLTVALAQGAGSITAVERDPEAAEACRHNLARRGLPGRVWTGEAGRLPRDQEADVMVLDPPREGAADALPVVTALSPRRIVYVSCDPESLGRDLRTLVDHGYTVDHASAFDMFPHTSHVEAVVRLRAQRIRHDLLGRRL